MMDACYIRSFCETLSSGKQKYFLSVDFFKKLVETGNLPAIRLYLDVHSSTCSPSCHYTSADRQGAEPYYTDNCQYLEKGLQIAAYKGYKNTFNIIFTYLDEPADVDWSTVEVFAESSKNEKMVDYVSMISRAFQIFEE